MTKRRKRVYVSGPMTGLPAFNFPAFDAVEALLVAADCVVFSPAANDRVHWAKDGNHDVEEQDYFINGDVAAYAAAVKLPVETLYRDDFNYLVNQADTIVLLPGWEKSTGARYELAIAEGLNLDIVLAVETPDGWSLVPTSEHAVTEYLRSFSAEPVADAKPEFSIDVPPIDNFSVGELLAEAASRIPAIAADVARIQARLA